MEPITAVIDNTRGPIAVQPFARDLQLLERPQADDNFSPFSTFFNAALGMVNDTNQFAGEAEQLQLDFATGRLDDILAVQMAMDRMGNALTFTTQVTNRVIEAYREIMRMQI
jgi:flagellar hook-basal body complex protein FliE